MRATQTRPRFILSSERVGNGSKVPFVVGLITLVEQFRLKGTLLYCIELPFSSLLPSVRENKAGLNLMLSERTSLGIIQRDNVSTRIEN